MSKNWSMSIGSGRADLSGIVSPAAKKPSFGSPGVTWRNLSPSADFGRIITVESTGRGSALLSRLSDSSAATLPFPSWTGTTDLTTPTRTPPMRTSLPLTRAFAFGTFALRL
jgi:hypothetical protein